MSHPRPGAPPAPPRPLRIGIVGCGGVAKLHAAGYRAVPGVEIAAVADTDMGRAYAFARDHGVKTIHADIGAMLSAAGPKLDAVSICTPNVYHHGATLQAIAAGVAVLVEKPIAMNARQAEEMVVAAEAAGVPLTVGHHMRHQPFSKWLKERIEKGDLGRIHHARCHALRRAGIPAWGVFHLREMSGGGALMDIGVHTLDLVLWLMGNPEPRAVSAINNFRRPGGSYVNPPAWGDRDLGQMDVEQYSAGFVRIADDVSLSLEASWVGHLPDDEAYPQLILGDRGGARITPFGSATPVEMFTRDGVVSSRTVPEAFPETVAHTEQIRNWCAALRGEEELVVEPWQCVDVMRIIDGFYESSGVGAEVRLARRSPRQTLVNGAGGESRV